MGIWASFNSSLSLVGLWEVPVIGEEMKAASNH